MRSKWDPHTAALKDLGDLLAPVLVKHLIGLVDDGVLDARHGNQVRLVHQIAKTTRGSNQDVTALGEIKDLLTHRVATVSGAWAQH